MKRILSLILSVHLLCLAASVVYAADPAPAVNKANKLYQRKKYDEALSLYNQALTEAPESPIINYDKGSCEYRLGDFEKAAGSFKKSLTAQEKKQEAWAYFNLGNSRYKQGELKQETDLSQAVKSLEESVRYYKRAIELDPKDNDAKINYELADRLLGELKEKLKQQRSQEKQDQEQKQNQQKKRDPQQEPSEKQQEDKQQEEKEKGQQQQEENNKQKQPSEDNRQKENQQIQEQQQQAGQDGDIKKMSQQEAGMLLEGFRQEEKELGRLQDMRRGSPGDVLKDW
jgi:Ca-activated chloride channel family protein